MKKFLAIFIVLAMLTSVLAACNTGNLPQDTTAGSTTAETEPKSTEAPTTAPVESETAEQTQSSNTTENTTTDITTEATTTEAPTESETETETETEVKTESVTTETAATETDEAPEAPETTEASEPQTTEEAQPETTEAYEPVTTETHEPETTEEPEIPETTEKIQPETTEEIQPETTEAYEPVTTETPEPETTEEPEIPETTEATRPETTEEIQPETTEAPEPEVIFKTDLTGAYITCDDSLADIATELAKRLSDASGKEVVYGTVGGGIEIALVANGNSSTASDVYSISYSDNVLAVSAINAPTLAFAIGDIASRLQSEDITEGYSKQHTITYKTANATDTALFKYCGTWQASDESHPTTMVSYWKVAYVEIDFTGNAITLMFSSATSFKYKVDGGAYVSVNNVIGDYTVMAEGEGKHTVQIYCSTLGAHMYFAGVKTEQSFTLSRTPDKAHYVQFIGDSITTDSRGFSHNSADILGWDYSVTSISGISLVRNTGYWRHNNGWYWDSTKGNCWTPGTIADYLYKNFGCMSIGMEDAFFKLGIPNFGKVAPETPSAEFIDMAENYFTEKYDYDFATGNSPDIVFIFLGTNDLSATSSNDAVNTFVTTYKAFIRKILAKYGQDTQICIMQSLTSVAGSASNDTSYGPSSPRVKAIERVATELSIVYDNISYIDYQTVLSWNVEISDDNVHPSAAGYQTLTEKIAEFLAKTYK